MDAIQGLELYIGLGLIVIGALIYLFVLPQGSGKAAGQAEDGQPANPDDMTDEQKAELAKKNAAARSEALGKLVVPHSMPEMHLYFGSQTGTAEKLATQLVEEADEMGITSAQVVDFNNFNEEKFLSHKLIIVCVATHYEGDPCDNTRAFYKWLKKVAKDKTAKPLAGVKFTIFGLGDTSYEQYNEMGKQFDELFEQLGATRVFDMGVGNAETFSTETDFDKWKENLWPELFKLYAAEDTPEQQEVAVQRRASLTKQRSLKQGDKAVLPWLLNEAGEGELVLEEAAAPTYDLNMRRYAGATQARIKSVRQLRQDTEGGSTLEVIYDVTGTGLTYVTASNFALYPLNKQADVEQFAKMFALNLDAKFKWAANPQYSGRQANTPFPIPAGGITYRDALSRFIDLTGAVTKKLVKDLVLLCEAQADKDK